MSISKKDEVFGYLREHPDATPQDIIDGLAVSSNTAYRWLKAWKGRAKMSEKPEQTEETEDAEARPLVAYDREGVVAVDRAYLEALEALRDQVIETQRLRRLLDNR